MKKLVQRYQALFLLVAVMLVGVITACEGPSDSGTSGVNVTATDPASHTHSWGNWTATAYPGTEQRVCATNASHIEHRLTGTDRFVFEAANSDSYRVGKGTLTSGEVRIPAYYRRDADSTFFPVTEIGSNAFQNCTGLTGITIPENVASIGGGAFSGCTRLTSVTIPAGVTSIGSGAFSRCTSLASITIPASVTSIGNYAFDGCTGLTSITIPASVTSIGVRAFSGCTSLTSVTFEGTIASASFDNDYNPVFPDDLRTKFYANDSANGTPGTYIIVYYYGTKVWTKQ